MIKKFIAPLAIVGLTVGSQLIISSVASAHHPLVDAEVVCADAGGPAVAYTSTAWEGGGADPTNDPSRANAQIDIALDGVVLDSGAYVAPSYSFAGLIPLPAGAQAGDAISVTATAVATWGNGGGAGSVATVSVIVPVLDCSPPDPLVNGRFTGGGHQMRVDGVRVTRGLTIHCDLLLSNNLEINWQGNQFHMLEHLTTVECSDDPNIIQAPPPAPLDTLIGVGEGRYNGAAGYTVEFTLQDHGEPGRNDRMAIFIYETANPANVILDIPLQVMSGGNLQAHYDQPHK